MTLIATVEVQRNGTFTTPAFPGAEFADYASLMHYEEDCRHYEAAVSTYFADIQPAAVRKMVRALRVAGYDFATSRYVRQMAEDDLREALLAIPGNIEEDVQWHLDRPGQRMRCGYALVQPKRRKG
jgi:hypothetical protein